ncbi:hypothetical protein E9840_11785 [Tissierella creatinini]|nr:hypothetical protein E9840_11785 [Tissierella creatinini]TJX52402.1 hypothetical protein E8P77_26115 [Soehngenia saccharolytica]
MIKAYLASISTQYEGEAIEARYRIFNDGNLIINKSLMLDYIKPVLVGHATLDRLLEELEDYNDQEIKIYINDGALFESVNGTSGTKNHELLRMAKETRKELDKFHDLEIINVNGNHEQLTEWNEILKP